MSVPDSMSVKRSATKPSEVRGGPCPSRWLAIVNADAATRSPTLPRYKGAAGEELGVGKLIDQPEQQLMTAFGGENHFSDKFSPKGRVAVCRQLSRIISPMPK